MDPPGQHPDLESGVKVTGPDIESSTTVSSPVIRPLLKLSTSPLTAPMMGPFQL